MKYLILILCLLYVMQGFSQTENESKMDNKTINEILESQYRAALQMLRQTIEKIPSAQWKTDEYKNPNWQIAYHATWAAQLYLGANMEAFVPWEKAIKGAESLGGTQDWENPDESVTVEGYNSKDELLSFINNVEDDLQQAISKLPIHENSGFEWYPYSRLELHINNIRHIQHHTAQLIERMKAKGITGFPWAIDGNPPH
ncbi:DinB family protein [Fulvivirgaceae bacterium BMA12]|uniref:DinB family protein n=1 Tax=Agaribacillus aureus TaxID=3051825 RepID=A0ABT8LBC4_9BACT|nr:DinB family protein [Fulvivirgaceae bacterium BMA12]